jgi:hypothetical protein
MLIFSIIKPMKRLLPTLFLLVTAVPLVPLFAADDGGDGAVIPDYQELVREGYGPRESDQVRVDYYSPEFVKALAKPTQAYYGKGYTIYYGYTTVIVADRANNTEFAFGHPLAYYKNLMPRSLDQTDLSRYALEVRTEGNTEPGEYVAQRPTNRNAVTTVQNVTPAAKATAAAPAANPLPPVAEKLSH